jgi:hypothetical protein
MAILALNSGLWMRGLLIGGSPDQGHYPASEIGDETCPEKLVQLPIDLSTKPEQNHLPATSLHNHC